MSEQRALPREVSIVRVKLGPERPASQPDPLGRDKVGFADGLNTAELWERGRGVWKAKLATLSEAELLVVVANGRVELVGTVDGVTFHDDRAAVTGRPLPDHPLVGEPDPIPNRSQNPIAYGSITTAPASTGAGGADGQRTYDEILSEAIAVMSEAVHWRRQVLHQPEPGRWEPHPTRTEPGDWAEFVALALAGAAANAGGIEAALAGRSGSWEANHVRNLLEGTVGADEHDLWRHRTEPLTMTLDVDRLVHDVAHEAAQAYTQATDEAQRLWEAAERDDPEPDDTEFVWWYDRDDAGDFIARDPAAPPWSWDAWREQPTHPESVFPPDTRARVEESLRNGVGLYAGGGSGGTTSAYIAKSQAAAEELWRLEAERDARIRPIAALGEDLEAQRLAEWQTYGDALKTKIEQLAEETPGLNVPVHIAVEVGLSQALEQSPREWETLQVQLLEAAIEQTPSPADLPGTPLSRLRQRA